jgi:hypothetical protein
MLLEVARGELIDDFCAPHNVFYPTFLSRPCKSELTFVSPSCYSQ